MYPLYHLFKNNNSKIEMDFNILIYYNTLSIQIIMVTLLKKIKYQEIKIFFKMFTIKSNKYEN